MESKANQAAEVTSVVSSKSAPRDVTPAELMQMAKTYLKIPAALILVELVYKILTAKENALGGIQVLQARIWNWLNNAIYGEGTSELVRHKSGLMTQVELHHDTFPMITESTILLYVSDECAGIHEMLFLATLVLLSPAISHKTKAWSIVILSAIVAGLNMARLLVLYPLAVKGCDANPDQANCAAPMMEFHNFVFEWGFLITLTVMWMIWFLAIGGVARVRQNLAEEE